MTACVVLGLFRVISAFYGTSVAQNAEITRKSPSSVDARRNLKQSCAILDMEVSVFIPDYFLLTKGEIWNEHRIVFFSSKVLVMHVATPTTRMQSLSPPPPTLFC